MRRPAPCIFVRLTWALVLAALVALPAALPAAARAADGAPGAGSEQAAWVERAIDGDTVALATGRHLRYIGIDAPEVRRREHGAWVVDPEPFGLAALAENRRLVEGRPVRLRFDVERTDRFGRLLAYVYVGDLMVNEHLVRKGLARAHRYGRNHDFAVRLEAAERDARDRHLGLWADGAAP